MSGLSIERNTVPVRGLKVD